MVHRETIRVNDGLGWVVMAMVMAGDGYGYGGDVIPKIPCTQSTIIRTRE